MLIYFCILLKVKLHTKHILFCTILVFYILFQEYVFKYVWIFFFLFVRAQVSLNHLSILSPSWRADLLLEADVGLAKDTASHRSQYSLYSLHDNEAERIRCV